MKNKYWIEALESLLDEHGCYSLLTEEQRVAVAEDLRLAHEMHAEATGQLEIENPFFERERELNRKLDAARKDSEKWQNNFRLNVSMRHNVPPNQIELHDGGHATVRSRP